MLALSLWAEIPQTSTASLVSVSSVQLQVLNNTSGKWMSLQWETYCSLRAQRWHHCLIGRIVCRGCTGENGTVGLAESRQCIQLCLQRPVCLTGTAVSRDPCLPNLVCWLWLAIGLASAYSWVSICNTALAACPPKALPVSRASPRRPFPRRWFQKYLSTTIQGQGGLTKWQEQSMESTWKGTWDRVSVSCHCSCRLTPLTKPPSTIVTGFPYGVCYWGESALTCQVYGPPNGYMHLGLHDHLLWIWLGLVKSSMMVTFMRHLTEPQCSDYFIKHYAKCFCEDACEWG